MSFLILAALAATQQQTVTFTHTCDRAEVVLEALGKELGVEMKPSGSIHDDYFLVRFDGVPVQEALEKIATTLNATWSEKSGVRYLERTRKQEVEDFESEYAWKAQAIKDQLASYDLDELTESKAKSLAVTMRDFNDTGDNDAFYKFQPTAAQLPGSRAMFRLIQLLDINAIVKATGTPVRYMTNDPKFAFPRSSDKVFEQMYREWAVFTQQASAAGLTQDNRFASTYQRFVPSKETFSQGIQLSVHLSDDSVLFMMSFINEGRWENLGYQSFSLTGAEKVPEWMSSLSGEVKLETVAADSIKPMSYSEVSEAVKGALLDGYNGDVALSAPSQCIEQAAEQLGTSVVAYLPDSAYRSLSKAKLPPDAKLSAVLTQLLSDRKLSFKMEDGWLTVRPMRPYTDRRERMDRGAFEKMFRYTESHRSLPLNVFADFVATTTEDNTAVVADCLLGRAVQMRFGLPNLGVERIRVYGLLNSTDRTLAKTDKVVLTARPDSGRFALAVAKNVSGTMEGRDDVAPGVKKPFNEEQESRALLPSDMTWSISVRDADFLQPNAFDQQIGAWVNFFDINSYAMNMYWSEKRPSTTVDYSAVAALKGAAMFLGYSAEGMGGQGFARYVDPIGTSHFGSINDLPADIKTQLEKDLENWRNRNKGGGE